MGQVLVIAENASLLLFPLKCIDTKGGGSNGSISGNYQFLLNSFEVIEKCKFDGVEMFYK